MENFELIISILEGIFALLTIGCFIWTFTKEFKLKGFVLSLGGIILIVFCLDLLEKFINYSLDNKPIYIIILFAFFAIFFIWIIFITVKENLTSGDNIKRKFIKDCIQQLKVLGFSLLVGFAIVGLILWSIILSN